MNKIIKNLICLVLLGVLIMGGLFNPSMARETDPSISSVQASYKSGIISISGTIPKEGSIKAVALFVYKGETLVQLIASGVKEDNSFFATISKSLDPGQYTVRASKYEGGPFIETTFIVASPPPSSSASSGGSDRPIIPTYKVDVSNQTQLEVQVDSHTNTASANLEALASDLARGENLLVTMPSIPGVGSYSVNIPVSALAAPNFARLTIKTVLADLSLPTNMFSGTGLTGRAEISIENGDKERLPSDLRAAIGDRPLVSLNLSIDDKETAWTNLSAPVILSFPYNPSQEEIENPEAILIWYIDGEGKKHIIPSGRYDPIGGRMSFTSTHFSDFAVAFNKVTFKDVPPDAWYKEAIEFIGAREITSGTGGGNYSPGASLKRGDFLVLVMKAYGIEGDESPTDNFLDAGDTYYTSYLGAGKRLGITSGIGDNMYGPAKLISRQDMFTLLYNTLKLIKQVPQADSSKKTLGFTDADQISPWAREAMEAFVKGELVAGTNGQLRPREITTRAQMAQVLYNLLGK